MAAVNALAGGAPGFVDTRTALAETGHELAATTHHPGCYHGASSPSTVTCTTRPPSAWLSPKAACYLVHSLSDADFSATTPA